MRIALFFCARGKRFCESLSSIHMDERITSMINALLEIELPAIRYAEIA